MSTILVSTTKQNTSAKLQAKIANNIINMLNKFPQGRRILADALNAGDIIINFTNTYIKKPEDGFIANWDLSTRTINIWFDAELALLTKALGTSDSFPYEVFCIILFELCNAANAEFSFVSQAKDYANADLYAYAVELKEFKTYQRCIAASNEAIILFNLPYPTSKNYQSHEFEKYWEDVNQEKPIYRSQKTHANGYRNEWHLSYMGLDQYLKHVIEWLSKESDYVERNRDATIDMMEKNVCAHLYSPICSNMPSGQILMQYYSQLKGNSDAQISKLSIPCLLDSPTPSSRKQ